MLKVYVLVFTALTCQIIDLSSAEDDLHQSSCDFPDCIFEGRERSCEIERYTVFLNVTLIPDDFADRVCPIILPRAQKCSPLREACPTTPEFDYDYRLHDGAYVSYLIDMTNYACSNVEELFTMKKCFTPELQLAVQSCIHRDGYDAPCLREEYDSKSHCPHEADAVYHAFVNHWLLRNPYNTRPH